MTAGVVYIVYGDNARREMGASRESVKRHSHIPVHIISDAPQVDTGARWQKVNLDTLSPYDETVYLDADTRAHGKLAPLFDILTDGWDMALSPSTAQGGEWLWHLPLDERNATQAALGFVALQLQAGVLAFRKTDAVLALFDAWRSEWGKWRGQDQGALLRALYAVPVRLWLLGYLWNKPSPASGGCAIEHCFGMARA